MGIFSALIVGGLVFGNSYMLFQGQMRNIGLARTLGVLLLVPFPLNVLVVFGSKLKDGKNGLSAHMINSFHKNFFRNVLTTPLRVFAYAGTKLWSYLGKDTSDESKVLKACYGRLYDDAAADMAAEEKEKEDRIRMEEGLDERSQERSQELDRREAEIAAREKLVVDKELAFASTLFSDCERIGKSFEIKGVELPDGSRIFSAPELYRSSVEESLRAYFAADGDSRPFRVVCRDDYQAEVQKSVDAILASAGETPLSMNYYHEGIELSDGRRFIGASDGNVSKVQACLDRLGIEARVVSEKKLSSLRTENVGAFTECAVGSFGFSRCPKKDCSLFYTPTEMTVSTRDSLLGMQSSGYEFKQASSHAEAFNDSLRDGLSQKGVRGLIKGDHFYFDHGLQLEVGKDSVSLLYGDGVPQFLGEIAFNPYNGEGNEFIVTLDGLKRMLAGEGFSSKDIEAVKRALEHGLGQKFDTADELVSRMESLRGPELCDVWCNSVKEPNNLSALFEQQTLTGFKAVEYNSKVDEARVRQQKAEQKIVVENYQKVKVGPSLS